MAVPTTLAVTPPATLLIAAAMPFSVMSPEPTETVSLLPLFSEMVSDCAPEPEPILAEPEPSVLE